MSNHLTPTRILTRFIKALLLLVVLISAVFYKSLGQPVAVSAYFNKTDPKDEWTELIVLSDNVDMRGWSIRDNSASNNWQTAINFNNIAFWDHMRIGTIIMIWHRQTTSSGINHPKDINKTDGYIELYAFDPTYFSSGDITNTLNLSSTSDMIQLRNSTGSHIHVLAHGSPALGSFTALPSPKLNHLNSSISDGDAIYVCPGAGIADYGTNLPNSGTTYSSRNNSTLTFGLANTCVASATGNKNYWRSIREPQITAQSVNPTTIIPGLPGSVSFTWTTATDPYNTDTTVRYLILRNTSNSFSNPTDGTTYSVGGTLGASLIVGIITHSFNTSFIDNTVMNGSTYYYRVYAYRYSQDDLNGNSYSLERGSAYNTVNFVSVIWPNTSPLPVELLQFDGILNGNQVDLAWSTASEQDNEYFTIEKTIDGNVYEFVGIIKGSLNSVSIQHYRFTDKSPFEGTSYYRLKQTDRNGMFTFSNLVAIQKDKQPQSFIYSIYPNPVTDKLYLAIESGQDYFLALVISDAQGKISIKRTVYANPGSSIFELHTHDLAEGLYFITVSGENIRKQMKFIKY